MAFGSRGVGFRRATADGLAAFHARAVAAEPLCRVVDDIVVSGFFAAKHVPVADVPGFSFKHRPWRQNKYVHETSKVKRLRSANRTLDNARCHAAIAATLGETDYWTPAVHKAAFALPAFVARRMSPSAPPAPPNES